MCVSFLMDLEFLIEVDEGPITECTEIGIGLSLGERPYQCYTQSDV